MVKFYSIEHLELIVKAMEFYGDIDKIIKYRTILANLYNERAIFEGYMKVNPLKFKGILNHDK